MQDSEFSFECECGNTMTLETCADPGLRVWVQCDHCGEVWRALLPGEYTGRKTRVNSQQKQEAIFEIFAEMKPKLTVRQVYYRLAVMGVVPKTQRGYRQTQYQLAVLRRRGILPYGWIADNTRWQIMPTVYNGIESAMQIWHDTYRRDLWESQSIHVEIWVEKDALAGVIAPITRQFAVPLYVARGFSSMTFAHDAAEELRAIDKPAVVYHFGDFDPSGVSAAEALKQELALHGSGARFERVAITEELVDWYGLPTLPVNHRDPRAKTWPHSYVCELDALPPDKLREMVEGCIMAHIDSHQWYLTKQAEETERRTLDMMRGYFVQERNNETILTMAGVDVFPPPEKNEP